MRGAASGRAARPGVGPFLAAGLLATHLAGPLPQLRPPLASAAVAANDRVVRVLDANAVKLERSGVVRLAGASTPTVGLPECFRYSPSAHLRRALPNGERVAVQITDSSRHFGVIAPRGKAGGPDAPSVNEALVAGGWARATRLGVDDGLAETLAQAQARAQASQSGLWVSCAALPPEVEATYDAIRAPPQSQPVALELGEGETVRQGAGPEPLQFRERCGEYEYYEDAKRAFDAAPERLSRLDSDGDGVPCGGLPHRPEIERRRLKVPRQVEARGS